MADRTFLIRFRSPEPSTQHVIASRAQVQGEHLVLFNAQGKLAALFSLNVVESWNDVEAGRSSSAASCAG
jgi:hypothetical protein